MDRAVPIDSACLADRNSNWRLSKFGAIRRNMSSVRTRLVGWGKYLPDRVMTNKEVLETCGTINAATGERVFNYYGAGDYQQHAMEKTIPLTDFDRGFRSSLRELQRLEKLSFIGGVPELLEEMRPFL